MRIYDTLTATKRPFEPLGSPVKIYFCGLTPKNYPHIGHAKTYVTADVMRRYLRYLGHDVLYVQNFTDIDDKTIARAREEGVSFKDIADRYTQAYFEHMAALNVERAERYPSATAAIPGIIRIVQGLIDKDYAYAVGGNVYYRVSRFPAYGRLSKRTAADNRAGAGLSARKPIEVAFPEEPEGVIAGAGDGVSALERDEVYLASLAADAVDAETAEAEKEDPRDFALWKASKPGEPAWESPWGPGRPAWHIECTTMVFDELGEQIDIHGGGQDLIFPHHENEIAQSEAYSGRAPFATFWVHIALLNTVTPEGKTEKMAHSLGNFTTIGSMLERYEPGVLRLYLLSQHYRTPANFDLSVLDATKEGWERLRTVYSNAALLRNWAPFRETPPAEPVDAELNKAGRRLRAAIPVALDRFRAAMDDDFNTSLAISALYDLAREFNRFKDALATPETATPSSRGLIDEALAAVEEIMGVLGLPAPDTGTGADPALATRVEALLEERARLRNLRDFAGADRVRDELEALDVVVEDHPQGTVWRRRR